jgi:hypothetical protein
MELAKLTAICQPVQQVLGTADSAIQKGESWRREKTNGLDEIVS